MKIQIIGGRLIDPANQQDSIQNLYVDAGRVIALGQPPEGFQAERSIDAQGLVVCPGLIDLQAHVREPGQSQKGSIASEGAAAAAGGVTTLCCPPTTQPVLDAPAVVRLIKDRAEEVGNISILPIGAMTQGLKGEHLSNMVTLSESGCIAMSNVRHPIRNTQTLNRCLEYAATYDLAVFFQSQDPDLSAGGCAHDGETSTRLGLSGIPDTAETTAVARNLLLVEKTGVRAHFGQLSAARSVRMIQDAQKQGLAVTADAAIQNLLLTDEYLEGFSSLFHLNPPLRSAQDREGLRTALRDGVITAICSDHQPHEAAAKRAPFAATETGMAGLETLLPLGLKLVEQNLLPLDELIARLTLGPARILGLDLGHLSEGARADVCLFDPGAEWQLTEENSRSRGLNTPFLNQTLKGQVRYTLLKGEVVFEGG